MKTIGILLSLILYLVMAGLPIVSFAISTSSNRGVDLFRIFPFFACTLLLAISIYGAVWIPVCIMFYKWFESQLKL